MSPPRIVHLTTVHRLRDPRIFYKQVRSLRAAGYDVRLVAQHTHSGAVDNVPVVALRTAGPLARLRRLGEAWAVARAETAALYHFHDPELIPVAWALKRATGAKVIFDRHEDYSVARGARGMLVRPLERWCFHWIDHVVLVDAAHAASLPSGLPHTVVANYFHPHGVPPQSPRTLGEQITLLYTGVHAAGRGLFTMLDLARQAPPDVSLTMAGACYLPHERTAAVQQLRTDPSLAHAQWVGEGDFLPWPSMVPHYTAADVGLVLWHPHPNRGITIPSKFYEYLHFALPIICTDFPRWRTFVEEHACGVVVPPGDHAAALAVLAQWRAKPEVYARLSANAARATMQFRWDKMGTRLNELYRALLMDQNS